MRDNLAWLTAASVPVILADIEGTIVEVSTPLTNLTGYRRRELVGAPLTKLEAPEAERLKRMRDGGFTRLGIRGIGGHLTIACQNGSRKQVALGVGHIELSGAPFVVVTLADRTPTQRARPRPEPARHRVSPTSWPRLWETWE